MKTFMAALLVSSMGSAFAAEKLCYDINLSFNTHPHRECPALKSFCLDSIHGKMALTMESGAVEVLMFTGQHIMNYSDVGQDIYDSYDSANMSIDLSHNNNGEWPATISEGFSEISLSTGVQEHSGAYVSQSCYYKLR